MAFDIKITSYREPSANNPTGTGGHIVASYSDIYSLSAEHILSEIISKIADKFVEEHYAEIEKELDPKLVAAIVAARMGQAVEEKMMKEINRVQSIADQALRRAKKG